jgi:hypothetical protein
MSDALELDVGAKLSLAIGATTSEVRSLRRDLQRAAARMPINNNVYSAETCPASGNNFNLDVGGPTQGRVWHLKRLMVGGGAFPFTAAGTAYLFVGVNPISIGQPPIPTELADFTTEDFPQRSYYSNQQITARAGERLRLVIVGGTAGVQYFAAGLVEDWPDRPTQVAEVD